MCLFDVYRATLLVLQVPNEDDNELQIDMDSTLCKTKEHIKQPPIEQHR